MEPTQLQLYAIDNAKLDISKLRWEGDHLIGAWNNGASIIIINPDGSTSVFSKEMQEHALRGIQ